jgi:uncharacterized protein
MAIFAVTYHYADKPESLDHHRPAHRAYLATCLGSPGLMAVGRTLGDGPDQALLLVEAEDSREVEEMLDLDPFWSEGLITKRDIREWTIVIGSVGSDDS